MQNKPKGDNPSSIPISQIDLEMEKSDDFPVPPPRTKVEQPFQKRIKMGKPQQQYLKIIQSIPLPSNSQLRPISYEELAMHRSLQSAWVSLNGTVYDVTLYMDYHPGGLELLKGCGIECAHLFNQFHPWVNASYLLQKFRLGQLVSSNAHSHKQSNQ